MKLYDNDAYREEFMALVYGLLMSDGTNDRANQIIRAFDMAPAVEAELLLPNDPLTLEELREMVGEPVWVVFTPDIDGERLSIWALVSVDDENDEIFLQNNLGGRSAYEDVVADIEAIYRRKPEEGAKNEN